MNKQIDRTQDRRPLALALTATLLLAGIPAAVAQQRVGGAAPAVSAPAPFTTAQSKALVRAFTETVFRDGRVDEAARFLAEDYIQHNPNVAQGRAGFVEAFRRVGAMPSLVVRDLIAEGDRVVVRTEFVFAQVGPEPVTGIDIYRVARVGGRLVIAEHWDAVLPGGLPPAPGGTP